MIYGISKIKSLKSFGIYENHDNAGCEEFAKYNLIYGWNGSGKSTLSRLFRCIENKTLESTDYTDSTFEIEYSLDSQFTRILTQTNLSTSPLNIRTFNHGFVADNINWNGAVKSILLVDEKKIKDRTALVDQGTLLKKKKDDYSSVDKTLTKLKTDSDKFLSNTAKKVKTSLLVIGTEDKKYFNYNKKSLSTLIDADTNAVSEKSLLSDEEIIIHTKAASPVKKDEMIFNSKAISDDYFEASFESLSELLKKSAVNEVIEFLKENTDIQVWVEKGLSLLDESGSCHFCGNRIEEERLISLNNHFSNEFKLLKSQLASASRYCIGLPEMLLPTVDSFFDEYQQEFKDHVEPLSELIDEVKKITDSWVICLNSKIEDPFNVSMSLKSVPIELIQKFNKVISGVAECVKQHNEKSDDFEKVTQAHKIKLERNYAATEVIEFDYFGKKKEQDVAELKYKNLKKEIDDLEYEIAKLEAELSNESIAVDAFNDDLAKFLGRTELSLKFDATEKGYRISRNGTNKQAQNLSEGEKTAIAFVYFVTKLKEHDNNINNTIVVIDDPVSSFDSNHLFHSYAFLKKHCEGAKQVFVLTHNFSYFKLVRDWIMKKNKYPKDSAPVIKSKAYTIESKDGVVRESKLVTAGITLTQYNSEYHYLFSKLYSFKDKPELNLDEVYLCANLSRKLLESFLCFKFPKKRSDFKQLVDFGVRGHDDIKPEDVERVYRFINRYSHNQQIELDDNTDNLLGESSAVLRQILDMVRIIDEAHYKEMEEVVTA